MGRALLSEMRDGARLHMNEENEYTAHTRPHAFTKSTYIDIQRLHILLKDDITCTWRFQSRTCFYR